MYACEIKFVGINVRGTCLIRENNEHLYLSFIYPLYTVSATYSTTICGVVNTTMYGEIG